MTILDLVENLDNIAISDDVSKIEQRYNVELNTAIKKLLSATSGSYDICGRHCRKLTTDEVLSFPERFGKNVAGLIPLFEISDDTFVTAYLHKSYFHYRLSYIAEGSYAHERTSIENIIGEIFKEEIKAARRQAKADKIKANAPQNFVVENGVLIAAPADCSNAVIPEGVFEIGEDAFKFRDSLTSIVIPEGVAKIGRCAFENCSQLSEVRFPKSLVEIGVRAFESTNLIEVNIPSNVKIIAHLVFEGCKSLSKVRIPAALTEFGNSPFKDCQSLKTMELSIDNGAIPVSLDIYEGTIYGHRKVEWIVPENWNNIEDQPLIKYFKAIKQKSDEILAAIEKRQREREELQKWLPKVADDALFAKLDAEGRIAHIDWKLELEDIMWNLKQLVKKFDIPVKLPKVTDEGDTEQNLCKISMSLTKQGYRLTVMDNGSDSYPIIIEAIPPKVIDKNIRK